MLEIDPSGFARVYPELWQMEDPPSAGSTGIGPPAHIPVSRAG